MIENTKEKVEERVEERVEAIDLNYYKKVYKEAEEARGELEKINNSLREQERKTIALNGALNSFSEYVANKYKIQKEETLDIETGLINRK